MSFLNFGFPIGRVWGISIRLHYSFLLYVLYKSFYFKHLWYGLLFLAGLYFCILLHEFGHAFACRKTGGVADNILIWPLGGLACCQPPFNATANFVTAVGGPFVTFLLWLIFGGLAWFMKDHLNVFSGNYFLMVASWFVAEMKNANFWLLIFNLVPAFPMDGGRIFRDGLWHWTDVSKATRVAVGLSRVLAVIGGLLGFFTQNLMLVFIAVFVWMEATRELYLANMYPNYSSDFTMPTWITRWVNRRKARKLEKIQRKRDLESSEYYISKRVDPILDKISREGIQSLTEEERRILEKAKNKLG